MKQHAKKILCAVLSLVLVLGVVITATLTTTMASAQTGWEANRNLTLRSTNNQWDQLTIVWDHFTTPSGQINAGFAQQRARGGSGATSGPTAFSVWRVYAIAEGGARTALTVHDSVTEANRAAGNGLRVWREGASGIERLQIRQGEDDWFGEVEVFISVWALSTVGREEEEIRNHPTVSGVPAWYAQQDWAFDANLLPLVRNTGEFRASLLNIEGLNNAIAAAEAIISNSARYSDDYIAQLRRYLTTARLALNAIDADGAGVTIARATEDLQDWVDQAGSNRFFLFDTFTPVAGGIWGVLEFGEMLLQLAAPIFSFITAGLELLRIFGAR
ncbi:MAG: hypothetical protein FWD06_05950 [Oscillospiraceae bacterium]|nr:hypothetical protein [Oscillospiraceae bacterium]